ncbi:MAG: putative DNA binding domain-containing protein [Nocardioides sp.]|nr:putative DNA binding domain-containing protein [Nocardioides sp.]
MYSAEVDQALALQPAQRSAELIRLPEGQWFERKSGRVAPRDLAVVLVALANAEGGVVIVGLHDGAVDGVPVQRVNALRQAAQDFTHPPVRVRVTEMPTGNASSAVLLALRVDPGEAVHELTNGDCYLRVGDESRRLGFAQRQELSFDRGSAPYDGTPLGEGLETLDVALMRDYQESIGSSSALDMLQARGLIGGDGRVRVAAHLLFATHPQGRFPHAHVRVLRYQSSDRGTGARLTLEHDHDVRIEGPVPHQIAEAADLIDRLVPRRRALAASGRFEGLPIVPRDAWLEGLVNAVLHRSYSAAGDHIRVEIFPDRLEISSPGRFPGLADPDRPLGIVRYARNPRLARVCSDLGIAQELGEGISRIFKEMRDRGLTDPIYAQTASSVSLVLSASDAVPEVIRERLPRGAHRVLDAMRRAGRPLGTGQVAELMGVTRPTAGRNLQRLRDEGLVVWTGDSAKDPRATWRLS